MNLLAFTPLYDPLSGLYPGMSNYWLWLVLPLVVAVSIVYKCTRIPNVRDLPKAAALMSFQIIVVMAFAAFILAAGYWAYIRLVIPFVHR